MNVLEAIQKLKKLQNDSMLLSNLSYLCETTSNKELHIELLNELIGEKEQEILAIEAALENTLLNE